MRVVPLVVLLAIFAGCPKNTSVKGPKGVNSEDVEAFSNYGYTFCDAKFLSAYWKEPIVKAQARIGHLLRRGDDKVTSNHLQNSYDHARQRGVRCNWQEAGFHFEDVEMLADYWQMDIGEAKAYIESKITNGSEYYLWEELEFAGDEPYYDEGYAEDDGEYFDDSNSLNAFWDSPYVHCDAHVLAEYWQSATYETKTHIGYKVMNGYTDMLEAELAEARSGLASQNRTNICEYWETDFEWNDAEALAGLWGVDITEAKGRITNKVFWGARRQVTELLNRVRGH
ncbi:MAG: hypothetical protein HN348_07620 [Proteobacteria bacterium]|nr:hypothetical protein [Pseudomonadota bacterium]